MWKLKFNTDDFDTKEILDGLKARFNSASAALIGEVKQEADRLAATRLKGGLSKWRDGFKVHKVDSGWFVLSIDGKMANWMEDGIQPGEISKAIMHGNRAESNKAEGKNYVDVPIAKDADALGNMSVGKGGAKVNVKAFANADALAKYMTTSDWKRGGTKKEKIVQQRVQDIIKTTKESSTNPSYVMIRRVTESSVWPKSPFKGAKVLDDLDGYIEQNWDKILERFM